MKSYTVAGTILLEISKDMERVKKIMEEEHEFIVPK